MAEEPWVPELTFGRRLLLLRTTLQLTQTQIAKMCEVSPATWNTWEHGAMPRDMASVSEKIERATRVSKEWLLWGSLVLAAPIILGTEREQMELPFDAAPPLLNVVGF